jgi:hypothetical protein
MEGTKLNRKATPFLQAMADLRYCAINEKRDILMKELFSPEMYERIKD